MSYGVYKEDIEIAEKNGISRKTLETRSYRLHWDTEQAVAKPPRKRKKLPKPLTELAEEHSIALGTLRSRLYQQGMDLQTALTAPIKSWEEVRASRKTPRITKEHIERALQNGIGLKTLQNRVYNLLWDIEKAVTKPVSVKKRNNHKGVN